MTEAAAAAPAAGDEILPCELRVVGARTRSWVMAEYDASQFHPRSLRCVLSLDSK